MVNIQKTVDIQFKNKIYKLEIVASQDILFINLKNIQDEEEWVGRHSKEYIQELTRKTGNFKKFGVFVEMLLSTVENVFSRSNEKGRWTCHVGFAQFSGFKVS